MGGNSSSNAGYGSVAGTTMLGSQIGGPLGGMIGGMFGGKQEMPNLIPPGAGQRADPAGVLESTGGALLLGNIAAGADPTTALESWLGVAPGGLPAYLNGLNPEERNAIQGIQTQVTQIASNTDLRNQVVGKLVNDYPNIMANSIKQFGQMENPAIQQAMQTINAKYGAGIGLSSGAAAAATGRATAGMSMDFAQTNFNQQLSEAEALRGFQQKMLGQGAQYGQSAAQDQYNRASEYTNNTNKALMGWGMQTQAQDAAANSAMAKSIGSMGTPGTGTSNNLFGSIMGNSSNSTYSGAQNFNPSTMSTNPAGQVVGPGSFPMAATTLG